MANLRIATTDSWTDRQSGQRQERTEWHSVVLFNKLAEIAQQYVQKGSHIYIEGRLQTRKWQAQDGQDRYSTEIVANDMQMLDSRGGGQAGGHQQQGGYAPPRGHQQQPQGGYQQQGYGGQAPQGAPPQHAPPQQPPAQGGQGNQYGTPNPGDYDDFDDEIPF